MAETDDFGTGMKPDNDRLETIEPEKEPEYVGAHSSIIGAKCQHWLGETRADIEQCGDEPTHTIVMWTGTKLAQMASCDDCGEPEDVDDQEREWTGEVRIA